MPDILSPYGTSVAIIGASPKPHKMSNKAVRAFSKRGFVVYPIHPIASTIEGLQVHRDLSNVGELDIVSIYVSPERQTTELADSIVRAKPKLVLFNHRDIENPDLETMLVQDGIEVMNDCSIIALGYHPDQFPSS